MKPKVLFFVTHLMGHGHLVRTVAIARACIEQGLAVRLVTGGMPIATIALDGLDVVSLTPVRSAGLDFSRLLDAQGRDVDAGVRHNRIDELKIAIATDPPDALVTELWPFGRRVLDAEFEAALLEVRALRPGAAWLISLRDVLVPPSRHERLDRVDERVLRGDATVLVHGERHILPLEASWPVRPMVASRTRYTGYVHAERGVPPPATAVRSAQGAIVVSGGGGVTSTPLLQAAAHAAALDDGRHHWRLLAGPGLPRAVREGIAQVLPPHASLEDARSDFQAMLLDAALSISQFGYNTAMDVIQAGCRAIVVPFESGLDREQAIRAARFADHGLVDVLPSAELDGASLLAAAKARLSRPLPDAAPFALDGGARAASAIGEAIGACSARGAA